MVTVREAKLCSNGAMQFAAEHSRKLAILGGSTCVLHVDGFPFPVADRSHLATPSPSGSRLDSVSPHTSGRAARVKDVPGRSRSGSGRSRSGPGRGRVGRESCRWHHIDLRESFCKDVFGWSCGRFLARLISNRGWVPTTKGAPPGGDIPYGLKTSVGVAPWRFRFGEAGSGETHVRGREICGKRFDML